MTNSSTPPDASPLILLTGATGYVGGRLLIALESQGARICCLTRRPDAIAAGRAPGTRVVRGDLSVEADVRAAMEGVELAYYLAHSMAAGGEFREEDRRTAEIFASIARDAGVERVVYLGALGRDPELSAHLASRQEVGEILRTQGPPTIELRSSIIIGAGSLSYELISSLVRRLPVMLTPRWVRTLTQPIAINDVIDYLRAAGKLEVTSSRVYEIGGRDTVSYGDLMREFADIRGLRRLIIPVPVLSPWLSSLWLGLVTPLYARVGRHLIEGVRNETIVHDDSALRDLPLRPQGVRQAITTAVEEESMRVDQRHRGPARRGHKGRLDLLSDTRTVEVAAPPDVAFAPIQRIGGRTGWYYGNTLWQIRGWLDLAFGGVGLRRGRRDPVELRPGDMVDFWKVEAIEAPHLLRLVAEMKLPGRAWLEYRVQPSGTGSRITQTASFEGHGRLGRMYWTLVAPSHHLVFPGMLRGIAQAAQSTP